MLVQRISNVKSRYLIPESLTHSAGTITASINSILYTCTLSGLTANTLYYLYLRSGSSNIQFVTTVPSSYRASFPTAVLIGAFYANGAGSVAFGSFVNIEGTPITQRIPYVATFSAGLGTVTNIATYWQRNGGDGIIEGSFTTGTIAGSVASASIPSNMTIDSSFFGLANTTAAAGPMVGRWSANVANPQRTDAVLALGTSTSNIYIGGPQSTTPLVPATGTGAFASAVTSYLEVRVPITNWNNTPLKDL